MRSSEILKYLDARLKNDRDQLEEILDNNQEIRIAIILLLGVGPQVKNIRVSSDK